MITNEKGCRELLRTVIETAQNGAINGDPECRQFFIDPYSNFRGMCAYMGLEPDIVARKVLAKTKRDIRFRLKSEGYKSSYYYNNLERERRRARERYRRSKATAAPQSSQSLGGPMTAERRTAQPLAPS